MLKDDDATPAVINLLYESSEHNKRLWIRLKINMWLQVHARRTGLLRSAADGEWVPLVLGDLWDVDVDVISRFELEELRTSDHQVSHLKVR